MGFARGEAAGDAWNKMAGGAMRWRAAIGGV